ncbi:AAA family ATPase [uncultured Clostridium sp.]|uniref:AAA family ATPase n=1 Tax=uncultured Clostridium sp. TaxID=59620 RepID=UPI00263B02E2|nr:AAA family ATPase [uncultured Clostridium sp.]
MKFKWIKLVGYAGIMQGMLKKEIYIDFTKTNSRIITILGDNGSGKSTLLKALSMFPDENSMFLPEYAEKSGCVIDDDVEYEFKLEHPVKVITNKETGENEIERKTTKAYIKKLGENGFIELNPNGTVSSYKDIVEAEFKLDANFVALSALSTEDKGIVEKTPSERKKFFNSIIEQVVVYNDMNKIFTKRNSVYKSMMNSLMSKIEAIGDEESVKNTLNSIELRLINLTSKRNELIKKIAEKDSTIKILDPDLSIQTLYQSIQVELETIDSEIKRLNSSLEYIIENNNITPMSLENANELYASSKKEIELTKEKIKELESSLEDYLRRREDESRSIQLKTQRLESLTSEYDYVDIENTINKYNEDIANYEKIFEDIKVKNAITISKDEYVTGLDTLKSIKEMIDGFKSFRFTHTISRSIDFIKRNIDVQTIISNNSRRIEVLKESEDKVGKDYIVLVGHMNTIKTLDMRDSKCKIDTCKFISEAVKLSKQYPNIEELVENTHNELESIKLEIKQLEEENNELNECLLAIRDINIILRNIDINKNIICKLPNGDIFLNTDIFLNKINNNDSFDEINDIYQYINYANIFELYKSAKDALYQLETDKKIYDSKNEIIDELNKDINEIQNKLNDMSNIIVNQNKNIADLKERLITLESLINTLDTVISILEKLKSCNNKQEDFNNKLNTISNNMKQIQDCLTEKEMIEMDIQNLDNELKPLQQDKEKLSYGLKMLEQYKYEFNKLSESYNTIEVLKKYSSPTKNGIQNLFIKVYMNQTLKLANEILSLFFDSSLLLTNYVVTANEFSISCYSSYSNMQVDDISSCSRSQRTMASLSLSAAMMKQSSSKFNIFRLDEIDEGLDAKNRLIYIDALNKILDILEVEQCIIVSHSSELNIGNVGIIKLRTTENTVIGSGGEIIFNAF